MKNSLANQFKIELLGPVLLVPSLLTFPPFVIYQFFPWYIRVAALLVAIIYCYCSYPSPILLFISAIYFIIIVLRDYPDLFSIWSSYGYYLIVIYGLLLYRFFLKRKNTIYKVYYKIYISLFFIIPIFSILSLLYYNLIGPTSLYGLGWDGYIENTYIYIETPFGLLIPKIFYGFEIHRSFFFFIEPNYLGFFYALNIFLFNNPRTKNERYFIGLNFFGGVITYSYTFFIILLFGFIIKKLRSKDIIGFIILLLTFLLLVYTAYNNASWLDRIERYQIFLDIFLRADLYNNIIGSGYYNNINSDVKGMSSGILSTLHEGGLIYTLIICILFLYISNKNLLLTLIIFMGLSTTELIKFPFFWFVFCIVSVQKIK